MGILFTGSGKNSVLIVFIQDILVGPCYFIVLAKFSSVYVNKLLSKVFMNT